MPSKYLYHASPLAFSKGPKQPPPPTRVSDNLRSEDTIEVLLGLGEGPWSKLHDGLKSFYIANTPLQASDGTLNFPDAQLIFHKGTALPDPVKFVLGGSAAGNSVGVNLSQNNAVTRTTTSGQIDAIDVRLRIDQLMRTTDEGDVLNEDLLFRVEVKPTSSGTWQSLPPNTGWLQNYNSNQPSNVTNGFFGSINQRIIELQQEEALSHQQAEAQAWAEYQQNADGPVDASLGVQAYAENVRVYGKTQSPVMKEIRIPVERLETDTYDVRVTKISAETNNNSVRELTWDTFEEIVIEDKEYPYTAMAQLIVKASDQLSNVPQMYGVYDTTEVLVPSIFNPVTRSYDFSNGPWDGTFKLAFTDDLAWIIYDLIHNDQHGIAAYYPLGFSKYEALEASLYWNACNPVTGAYEGVPRPNGGTRPRITFNGLIDSPRNSMELLVYMAGAGNAVFYEDVEGNFRLKVEKDTPATQTFNNMDVENGRFQYSFSDTNTRYNDITVVYRNKKLPAYQEDRRRVYDQADIDLHGRKPLTFVAVGCVDTDEAIARAYHKMVTSLTETRQVSFTTTRFGAYVEPHDIILIADEAMDEGYSRRSIGLNPERTIISYNEPLALEPDVTDYVVRIQTTDGIWESNVRETSIGTTENTVEINPPIPQDVLDSLDTNFSFSISSESEGGLKPYRVTSIDEGEDEDERIKISAIEVNRAKYPLVDSYDGTQFNVTNEQDVSSPQSTLVQDLQATVTERPTVDGKITDIELSWDSPSSAVAGSTYVVRYSFNDGPPREIYRGTDTRFTQDDVPYGSHTFSVNTLEASGLESPQVRRVRVLTLPPYYGLPAITGVTIQNKKDTDTTYIGKNVNIEWSVDTSEQWEGWASDKPHPDFAWWEIDVVDPNDGSIVHTYQLDDWKKKEFEIPYSDFSTFGLTSIRNFSVVVSVSDAEGNEGASFSRSIQKPEPTLTNISITSPEGFSSRSAFRYDDILDPDFKGVRIWVSQVNGQLGTLNWDGGGTPVVDVLEGDNYVTYAPLDVFGEGSRTTITVNGSVTDIEALLDADRQAIEDLQDIYGSTASAAQSAANALAASNAAQTHTNNSQTAQAASETARTQSQAARDAAVIARNDGETFRDQAEGFSIQASGDRNAAETAAAAASTSSGQAAASETNAAGSSSSAAASEVLATEARDEAEAARDNAANSASAAATSASSAASEATNATQAASAATNERIAAQTARAGAETARDESVTAKNNSEASSVSAASAASQSVSARDAAQGHANAAASSATTSQGHADAANVSASSANSAAINAQASRDNALSSANASAASAQQASASETAAAQSASASDNSKTQAQTAAGQASASAGAAALSESNAQSFSAAAQQSSVSAESFAEKALGARSSSLVPGGDFLGDPAWGIVEGNANGNFIFVDWPGEGRVLVLHRAFGNDQSERAVGSPSFPVRPGQKLKVGIRASNTTDAGVPDQMYFRLQLSQAYHDIIGAGERDTWHDFIIPGNDYFWKHSWHEYEFDYTVPANMKYASLSVYAWTTVGGGYQDLHVSRVWVYDVTSEKAAEVSASAAATSAQQASTSESNTLSYAQASDSSRVSAETASGQAQAFRDASSLSASQAANSATGASNSANAANASALAAQIAEGVAIQQKFSQTGAITKGIDFSEDAVAYGTTPTGWGIWGTLPERQILDNPNGGKDFWFHINSATASAGTAAGLLQQFSSSQKFVPGHYVLEVGAKLEAGSRLGAGVYVYSRNKSDLVSSVGRFLDFNSDPTNETGGVIPNDGRYYTYSKLLDLNGDGNDDDLIFHLMCNWTYWGTPVAKIMRISHCFLRKATPTEIEAGTVTNIAGQVSTLSSVIAEAQGRLSAHWVNETGVSNFTGTFISARTTLSNGVVDSNVSIGAREFGVFNHVNGSWIRAMRVSGGDVRIAGNLEAGAGIYLGTGSARWPVALEDRVYFLTDGQAVNFGLDIGGYETEFSDQNLDPLAAGETYSLRAINKTGTGFTADLKINSPSQPTTVVQATQASSPAGPQRMVAKADTEKASNDAYTFQFDGTVEVFVDQEFFVPGEPSDTIEYGGIFVTTWFHDGTSWVEGPSEYIHYSQLGVYPTHSSGAQTYSFSNRSFTFTYPNNIRSHASLGTFGISVTSGGSVTRLDQVSYSKQTVSNPRTATPAGYTCRTVVKPRNESQA